MKSSTLKDVLAVAIVCSIQAVTMAATTTQDTDAMMDGLLRSTGWRAEWQGPGGAGVTEVVFQRQAGTVIAKIRLITPFEMTCEQPVTVGPDTVTFDGCRDPAVTLTFDGKDKDIPFRGQSPRGYQWQLRAK
jgi:hypothetical protein